MGVFIGHMAVIAVDLSADPTNHNLLPFEFVILTVVVSPAFVGALVGQFLTRWVARGKSEPTRGSS